MWRKILITLIMFLPSMVITQPCSPDLIKTYTVKARDTDSQILPEAFKHFAWFNPDCTPENLLLVHLVGTVDNPLSTTYFPELAANNGFHAVSLKYPNLKSAQTPCRESDDADCYGNFRNEIIEGIDYSPDISVNAANSVKNRLLKLLKYLHSEHPGQGWNTYYSGSSLKWGLMVLSGHSQGGGHAAIIAKKHRVNRVIMFASPNDYSDYFDRPAPWMSQASATPDSSFYSFGNPFDDVTSFADQYVQWDSLGLASFGDTVRINNTDCPYFNSHQLYTTDMTAGLGGNHSNMIRDNETTLIQGVPLYEPVWKYLLDIPCATTGISEALFTNNVKLFPNPFREQTTLEFDNSKYEPHSLFLITLTGKLALTITDFTSEQLLIDGRQLESGVYLYQLLKNNRIVAFGKLVLQK